MGRLQFSKIGGEVLKNGGSVGPGEVRGAEETCNYKLLF